MQIFTCPACGADLYFHNTGCTCGQQVSFDPDAQTMRPLESPCANREAIACNWQAETEGALCRSCAMTEVLPDLREDANRPLWETSERAKRWMLANLARWGWFTPDDPGDRPVYRMLSEQTTTGQEDVVMGHANGVITINVTEASEAEIVKRQEALGELYRSMLGHMRHETAHFLHIRLSEEPGFPEAFRALFGDFDLEAMEETTPFSAIDINFAAPVLLWVYMFLTTIMLVNLLIAQMSDTYCKVSEEGTERWQFQRAQLILEYKDNKTPVPQPLNILWEATYVPYLLISQLRRLGLP